jgi:group I intron endonuclease
MFGSGIYKITQISTGRVYVGSSVDISKRLKTHSNALKKGIHHNSRIQAAYNETGEGSFIYEVLEVCKIKEMIERENFWIRELNAVEEGFNIAPESYNTGGVFSKERQKKLAKEARDAERIISFIDAMKEFVLYKDKTLNPDVYVGFHNLYLGLHIPLRLAKAGCLIRRLMDDVYSLEAGYYKINYVCFIKTQATYKINKMEAKSNFARKRTTNDIYDNVAEEIMDYLTSCKFGKKVLKILKEEGVVIERYAIEKEGV